MLKKNVFPPKFIKHSTSQFKKSFIKKRKKTTENDKKATILYQGEHDNRLKIEYVKDDQVISEKYSFIKAQKDKIGRGII